MLQYVAVCCSMLQYVAVCCSVLQYVAVCCSMLQYVAVLAITESYRTTRGNAEDARYGRVFDYVAVYYNACDE